MERDKALELFTDPAYKAICVNIAGQDADDLYQELFVYLAELPADKLLEITTTCPRCWFATAARQQYRSAKSQFHETYRLPRIREQQAEGDILPALYSEGEDERPDMTLIMQAVDTLHWYDYYVLIYYVETGSLRALSRKTKIPVKSLHNSIAYSKRIIKKYIHDHSVNRG